ncbi:ECF transporter S component [Amycolatopsis sp. La24]|uniref:ECF transporter S component n=1 Tax=Amycolatopsis sp. La24 TaxID=3028304 RepID=UPI0023AF0343|nr:ECF transporter S component [Amycolatopsis sp. La24]
MSPVRIGRWSAVLLVVSSVLGVAAFCWPFFVAPGTLLADAAAEAPLVFGLLLVLVLGVLLAQLADGGIDAKALALLGVLAAVNAALRPLGAGAGGIETVFFLLVLAGRVFGPGFGFTLGAVSLFASALLTGGIGPWLPFQMFGCAWVGLGAGLLPRAKGRLEIVLLAAYGAVSAFGYGLALNLSFWPFALGAHTALSFDPNASTLTNFGHYFLFDAATSLGWDTGRAVTNVVAIAVFGPLVLATLRRASRRAAFETPAEFHDARA